MDWLEDSISFLPTFPDEPYSVPEEIAHCQWWVQDQNQPLTTAAAVAVAATPPIAIVTAKPEPLLETPKSEMHKKRKLAARRMADEFEEDRKPQVTWAEQLLNPLAAAIDATNFSRAQHLIYVLQELASPTGDANHSLAFYGLQALSRRFSSLSSPLTYAAEKDVFLISSNAMRYNAQDTIYFRQARSIHELSKKSFENLRQESDDKDPEPKIVRRGRPTGRPPPAERAGSEFSSEASLANASNGNLSSSPMTDVLRRESGFQKPGVADLSARAPQCFQSSDSYILNSEHKLEKSEDYSGTTIVVGGVWKGPLISGKKLSAKEDNLRDVHKQLPLLTAPAGDRKILVPVGLHVEFAYARSLACFAANLGPIGWKLAARRIERALPPGTQFGPGWVGENHSLQPSLPPSSALSNASTASRNDQCPEVAEHECHIKTSPSPSSNSVAATDRISDNNAVKASMMQPPVNGFKPPFSPNLYQPRKFTTNFGL